MADWNVKKRGADGVLGAPWVSGATGPDPANDFVLVMSDGTRPTAIGDLALGFVVDTRPTDNAPEEANVHGNGSIIEDTAAAFTSDVELFSDGDGTISETEPAGAAGTRILSVGRTLSATTFLVDIRSYEKGA